MNQLSFVSLIVAAWVVQCYAISGINHWGVSRSCLNPKNSFDGWSIRTNNDFQQQFFGMYHGHSSPLVSRVLQNTFIDMIKNNFSPILNELDLEKEKSKKVDDKLLEKIKNDLVKLVKEEDGKIRKTRNDLKDSYSDAMAVIITRQFIISVNVGHNKAVAISTNQVKTISTPTVDPRDFMGMKANKGVYQPNVMVDIVPRVYKDEKDGSEHEIRFLVLSVEPIAKFISNAELSKIVLKGTEEWEHFDDNEDRDTILHDTIKTIKSTAETRFQPGKKDNKDQTIFLVKLTEILH